MRDIPQGANGEAEAAPAPGSYVRALYDYGKECPECNDVFLRLQLYECPECNDVFLRLQLYELTNQS